MKEPYFTCEKCGSITEEFYGLQASLVSNGNKTYYQWTCFKCGQIYQKEADPIIEIKSNAL